MSGPPNPPKLIPTSVAIQVFPPQWLIDELTRRFSNVVILILDKEFSGFRTSGNRYTIAGMLATMERLNNIDIDRAFGGPPEVGAPAGPELKLTSDSDVDVKEPPHGAL